MDKAKKKLCMCCTAGWILCLIGVVSIPVIGYVIKHQVEKTVVIKPDGLLYDLWEELPIPIYMQFYMFNVTNVIEILNGQGIPYVTQRGPYTYIEKRKKFNITFNPNGTVTYRQKRIFLFDRSKSVGDESDMFTTPNPVYWTLLASLKNEYLEVNKLLRFITKMGGEKPFMMRNISDIVWGYTDEVLHFAKKLDSSWFYSDFLGYFMNKNDTNDGVYTVHTGEKDIQMLGIIDKYNGSGYLNFWTTKYANMINGTDGTLGPPYLSDNEKMYLFQSDICRSVSGEWSSNVKVKGIELRRYTASFMYLANATINPDNKGFCTPQSSCLDSGLLNVSTCQLVDFFHIPAVMSMPHFYMASQRIQDSVEGLSPSAKEHQTYVDLEHNTGLVLSAAKRLQINLYIQPIEGFMETSKINPVILPVFWINESAVVNDKYANQLKKMLFIPKLVVEVIQMLLLSSGALTLLTAVLYGIYQQNQSQKISLNKSKKMISPANMDEDDRQSLISI